jgi:Arc/MetJ family transcription regulator
MKRTNLVLDEELLEEAKRITGSRTYSATVDRALRELVRKVNIRQILNLQGSGLWEGDLSEMRRDVEVSEGMVADRPWPSSMPYPPAATPPAATPPDEPPAEGGKGRRGPR